MARSIQLLMLPAPHCPSQWQFLPWRQEVHSSYSIDNIEELRGTVRGTAMCGGFPPDINRAVFNTREENLRLTLDPVNYDKPLSWDVRIDPQRPFYVLWYYPTPKSADKLESSGNCSLPPP